MALRFSLAAHTTYVCDRVVELRLAKIFCARGVGGGGGTRYIPGWGGAALPLIP